MRTHTVLVAALLSATMGGCHMGLAGLALGASYSPGPYQPGEVAQSVGPDSVRTLACLDVGFAIDEDGGPLLDTHVGNRCVHPEPFDLGRLVIRGKDSSGSERVVRLVDPRQEIERLHVGALERARERVRLDGLTADVIEVCFDVTEVAPDAPHARPLPMCLRRGLEGWQAEPKERSAEGEHSKRSGKEESVGS
jgi:hypothetical protein